MGGKVSEIMILGEVNFTDIKKGNFLTITNIPSGKSSEKTFLYE